MRRVQRVRMWMPGGVGKGRGEGIGEMIWEGMAPVRMWLRAMVE